MYAGYVIVWLADRHRIEAFIRRGVRSGFYSADSPTAAELVSDSDDNLFRNTVNNGNHLLHKLLPERTAYDYNLRQRRYDLTLHVKTDDKNFYPGCFLKTFIRIITYYTYFLLFFVYLILLFSDF